MNNGIEMLLRQQAEEIAAQGINGWGNTMAMAADEIAELRQLVEGLEAELETERMRLAACGVVASANTPESAEQQRKMKPEYWSASCADVAAAVDREMALRARLAAQPVAVEPEMLVVSMATSSQYAMGWNDCRAEMLATAPPAQARPSVEPLTWYEGEPPFPQNQEWFIAKTIHEESVVLKALPEEYFYDYTTADGTYMQAKNIVKWMQFPNCEYLPPKDSRPVVPDEHKSQWQANYEKLIFAVQTKYQDESRFETAMRYIQEAERLSAAPAAQEQEKPE